MAGEETRYLNSLQPQQEPDHSNRFHLLRNITIVATVAAVIGTALIILSGDADLEWFLIGMWIVWGLLLSASVVSWGTDLAPTEEAYEDEVSEVVLEDDAIRFLFRRRKDLRMERKEIRRLYSPDDRFWIVVRPEEQSRSLWLLLDENIVHALLDWVEGTNTYSHEKRPEEE